ncbi:hypothetical protein XENOCAPTIV_016198 [Xenoophorus captivus]|uniref:Uncharacterized protein n=1 Tax=Xenoophorus captivus TaxID=1517983 RepID=A0ABV0RE41_9TELE
MFVLSSGDGYVHQKCQIGPRPTHLGTKALCLQQVQQDAVHGRSLRATPGKFGSTGNEVQWSNRPEHVRYANSIRCSVCVPQCLTSRICLLSFT